MADQAKPNVVIWYTVRDRNGWQMETNNRAFAAEMAKECRGVVIAPSGMWRWTGEQWQKMLL